MWGSQSCAPILAAAGFQPALFTCAPVGFDRKRHARRRSSVTRVNALRSRTNPRRDESRHARKRALHYTTVCVTSKWQRGRDSEKPGGYHLLPVPTQELFPRRFSRSAPALIQSHAASEYWRRPLARFGNRDRRRRTCRAAQRCALTPVTSLTRARRNPATAALFLLRRLLVVAGERWLGQIAGAIPG